MSASGITLIVLFNLRSDVAASDYEDWARTTDLPIVRALDGVDSFDAYRTSGLFGSGDAAPYSYVEVIRVSDLESFTGDLGSDTMKQVAAEFQQFADAPIFMTAGAL